MSFGGLNGGTVVPGGNSSAATSQSGSSGGTLGGLVGGTVAPGGSSSAVTSQSGSSGGTFGGLVGGTVVPGGSSQSESGSNKPNCTAGYVNINNQCVPIPYLEETPKFTLVCPAEYTLNTNPDKSVVCVKNVAGFTPAMETFSQNNIRNTNNKCKARY